MWVATLAIAGIPPFSGFFSKDAILGAAFARGAVHPLWYTFWAMGVAAALLTAFYMTRLMLFTFHGPNRTGERERAHLHDGPPVMTVPLVILGILAAVGGALNLPPLLGGTAPLEHWLEPLTEASARLSALPVLSHGVEWTLIVLAIATAAAGIAAARRWLPFEHLVPAREAPAERGFARVLWKAYYVDQIYDRIVVKPIVWLSRQVLWKWIDQGVVDGAGVNGVARGSQILGWLGSRLQSGELGLYVVLFVVGAVLLLGAVG
jgi:NADH-quinone oxidoreductase subunit L